MNSTTTGSALSKLSAAQRDYLLALEPNRVDVGIPGWIKDVDAQFQNRSHRKRLKRPGLATAHSLIRKGVVSPRPEPCECGWHYASLTPLGIELQAALRARAATGGARGSHE